MRVISGKPTHRAADVEPLAPEINKDRVHEDLKVERPHAEEHGAVHRRAGDDVRVARVQGVEADLDVLLHAKDPLVHDAPREDLVGVGENPLRLVLLVDRPGQLDRPDALHAVLEVEKRQLRRIPLEVVDVELVVLSDGRPRGPLVSTLLRASEASTRGCEKREAASNTGFHRMWTDRATAG